MTERNVPIQSLIDHIKTAFDVDPWAKEMAEELLKEQKAKLMIENEIGWNCPSCGMNLIGKSASGYPCNLIDLPEDEPIHFCPRCGQEVKWNGSD